MKKLLAVVSCICLIFSLLSFDIITVNAATTEGCYKYSVSNGEAIIEEYDKYNGVKGELIIPSSLGGYPVTEIKSRAFYNNNNLTSVVIPGSILKIGDHAFGYCNSLKKLVIEEGVTKIGEGAFKNCSLSSVEIPKTLSIINFQAFQFCPIEKVYITDVGAWCEIQSEWSYNGNNPLSYNASGYSGTPSSYVKTAEIYLNNTLISELIIPEGVTRICLDAFHGCRSIKSVVIPSSITGISDSAFRECTEISDVWYTGSKSERENIKIGDNNTYLTNATWHYNSCPVGAPHSYSNDCDDTCNGCGEKRTVSGHSYDNTCDIQCNICNAVRKISHNFGDWTITQKATCIASGTKSRKCSVCQKTETDTVSSLGHSFSNEWTVDKKATCTAAGSKSKHCMRCSAISNNTTILASGHRWGEWVVEKKATTNAEGISARKCGECGLKETQTIAKLAADGHTHKFGEWQIVKSATCKEKGNAERVCFICKIKENKELLATGHQVGDWVETTATCTKDGVRQRTCVVCSEIEKITINALGHDFDNPIVIKEPTNSENGIKQGKCKRCGQETTEAIPALSSGNDVTSNTGKNPNSSNNSWVAWVALSAILLLGIGIGAFFLFVKPRLHNKK